MAATTLRRSAYALAVLLLLAAAGVAALPFLASTSAIRNRIAHEMGIWSGYQVTLGAAPEISLFPTLTATLKDVALSHWTATDRPPVITAEEIRITLSAVSAVSGKVRFTDMSVVRPRVTVHANDGAVPLPDWPAAGKIVGGVRAAGNAIAADAQDPDLSGLPADRLGTVTITDGRVVLAGPETPEPIATSIEGTLSWPSLNGAAQASLQGIWRGESIGVEIAAPQPLLLLAGGNGELTLALQSTPLTAGFSGRITHADLAIMEGAVTLETPSLTRALEWLGQNIAPGSPVGAVKLAANLTGDVTRAKLDDVAIELDDNPGTGALDVTLTPEMPAIAGTLAFESLNLQSFLSAISNPPRRAEETTERIETDFLGNIDLDLRLSAASASLGPVLFDNVAATARIKPGLAAFDISDATAFGGTVQAGMRLDSEAGVTTGELRILASDVDTRQMADALGEPAYVPLGRGTISLILQGPAFTWRSLLTLSKGSISAKLRDGVIPGISLEAFLERSREAGFFGLSETGDGELAFDSAELEADLEDGFAQIARAEIVAGTRTVRLSGIVPYADRGLALSGTIVEGDTEPRERIAAFFVGGSWGAPFISPIGTTDLPLQ